MANKTYLDKSGLSYFWSKIKTALNGKANTSDVPTKTSDLTNNSGFVATVELYSNTSGQTGNISFNGNYTDYDYLMITDDLGTGLLYSGKNTLNISLLSYADTLYQEYDVLKLTYNSSTQKTTIQHQYQGSYYSGSNHSVNYKIYKVYGIKI